jgi:two-component sensor histidine kinase
MTASIQQLYPTDEAQRLAALRRYGILDTPPDAAFDRITAMAARLFSVPMAVVSLVDEQRIWFKSHHGLEVTEIGRDPGLCASAILQHGPWLLTDASQDPRSSDNPLVTGAFGLRFYAGVPLRSPDGFNLGMLCVLDQQPHEVSAEMLSGLRDLAGLVMDHMELRLSARRAIDGLTRLAGEKEAALHLADQMTKEVDHRIKNSLELVSTLLKLQSSTSKVPECREQLQIAANRVTAIGRAHEHIHAADGTGLTSGKDYIRRLCQDLFAIIGTERIQRIDVEGVDMPVPPRQIISIGLIVNELVMNAAMHGAKRIMIALEKHDAGHALSVMDDGPGLPAEFDAATSQGLGMTIVRGQTQALKARLLVVQGEGAYATRFTVLLPLMQAD